MDLLEEGDLASLFSQKLRLYDNDDDYFERFKELLDSSSNIHQSKIKEWKNTKEAHIYCKINNINGQVTGILIENYIKFKYSMDKNKSSLCNGDLSKNGINYEVKASNGGKHNNKFNYVQIRMNHDCIYLMTAYYIDISNLDSLGELFIFLVNKIEIKKLLVNHGSYAHGTKKKLGEITIEDLNREDNHKEYALRPKFNDKCWNDLLQFRIFGPIV